MSNVPLAKLNYTVNFQAVMSEYQEVHASQGMPLIEFLRLKGMLFQPKPIEDYPDDQPIETYRPHNYAVVMVAFLLAAVLAVVLGYVFGFLVAEDPLWQWIIMIVGIIIALVCIYMGLDRGITKLEVFKDGLHFRGLFGSQIVYWKDILNFSTTTMKTTTRQKKYILCCMVGYENKTSESNFTLHVHTLQGQKSIDLNVYGVERGKIISKKIVEFAVTFSQNQALGSMSRQESNILLAQATKIIELDPGMAFEAGITALTLDDRNPIAWEFVANLLVLLDPPEAFPFLDVALQFEPNNANTLAMCGKAHSVTANILKAKEFYLRALRVDPNNKIAKIGLEELGEDLAKSTVIPENLDEAKTGLVTDLNETEFEDTDKSKSDEDLVLKDS